MPRLAGIEDDKPEATLPRRRLRRLSQFVALPDPLSSAASAADRSRFIDRQGSPGDTAYDIRHPAPESPAPRVAAARRYRLSSVGC